MEKDFKANYGMMIPQGVYREPKKADEKKWLCSLIGHRWQNVMVTTRDKTLPEECLRCGKKRWLSYSHLHKRLERMIFRLNRYVDIILRPLCYFNWHRWKGTFHCSSFGYPGRERHEEDHYKCVRCRKNKTIKIS